jgi:hypothetical protein
MASRVAAVGEDGRETRLLFRGKRGGGQPLPLGVSFNVVRRRVRDGRDA